MAVRQGAMGVEELIKRKVASLRYWKKTNLYKRHPKWDFQFSVMTYNILSQKAIDNHLYLYRNCNPAILMEDYRISRLLPEILQSKSDIICLQEVEQHVFDHRMRHVFHSNGFDSIFKKKTGNLSDGCAILWRKNKFDFVRECDVEYRAKGSKLLNRDNVGLIAVLKPIHPKMRKILLHVATTHLLFNPRRGDIKFCQLRFLLAELERMSLKQAQGETRCYHPVILCGDFNSEPHSPLYQFIETGSIDVKDMPAGDLSGQLEGRNKGSKVSGEDLLLHQYGISNASRFEKTPVSQDSEQTRLSENTTVTGFGFKEPSFVTESNAEQVKLDTKNPGVVPNEANAKGCSWLINYNRLTMGIEHFKEKHYTHVRDMTNNDDSRKPDSEAADLDLHSKQHFSHDFQFVPAYKYHPKNQKAQPITSMTGKDSNSVDHIFYNVKRKTDLTAYTEGTLRLLSIYTLMYSDDVSELGGLPNACLGSDHISLIAKFALCTHG